MPHSTTHTPTSIPPTRRRAGIARLVRRVTTTVLAAIVAVGAVSAAWAVEPTATVRTTDSDRIDALVADRMQAHGIPGASVAVVRDGQTIHLAGYGTADPDGTPVTPDTPCLIGSASKPVTALAVRQLVADGRLDLDEPVLPHLDAIIDHVPDGFEQVTVRQLLTHTGGLSMANGLAGTVEIHRGPDALDRRVADLLAEPLAYPPGDRHEYSNAGPVLLAAVVEQVTGQPFADHLAEAVFDPLGMHDSFGTDAHPAAARLATGHALWFGHWRPTVEPYDPAGVAMGYVGSTATDLARFLHAHLPPDPDTAGVPATAADIAAEPTVPTGWDEVPLEAGHGLGWFVDDLHGHRVVSHSGSLGTVTTHLVMVPGADGLGIAVQTNASAFIAAGHPAQYDLSLELTRLLLGLEPKPASRDVLLSVVAPIVAWLAAAGIAVAAIRWMLVARHRQRRRAATAPSWSRRWIRPVVLPGLAYLGLATALVVFAPLQAARHFYPDVGWGLTITAIVAAGWAVVRTVVSVSTIGRAARATEPAESAHVPQEARA